MQAPAQGTSSGSPRWRVTRKERPIRSCAAVAPSAITRSGCKTANSASSHGRQAAISRALGFLCSPPLPNGLPLEVLDRVRDVNFGPIDAGRHQCFIEQASGGADERPARPILLIARLLAHDHDASVDGSFAEHGLRARFPQWAGAAISRGGAQRAEGRMRRYERGGGFYFSESHRARDRSTNAVVHGVRWIDSLTGARGGSSPCAANRI